MEEGKHKRKRERGRERRKEEEVLLSSHPFPDSNTNYLNLLEEEEKAQLNSLFPSLTNLASPFLCLSLSLFLSSNHLVLLSQVLWYRVSCTASIY